MIDQTIIDQIVSLPIQEVISKYVKLKKSGSNYEACCPMHSEKTPSFHVFPETGTFKCFGCGVQGTGITFVMEFRKLNYPEACKEIGKNHNIVIQEQELTPQQQESRDKKESLLVANSFASTFFQEQLRLPGNKPVLDYALSRWSEETLLKFKIGYAPKGWHNLMEKAKANGLKEEILVQACLISESKKSPGKLFDYFQSRLMIPIFNATNQVVAFTGRTMDGSDPKYFNSRNTEVYKKSEILYGFNFASPAIRFHESAYLVEGNADVIRMHQIKVINTVGICSTSFTRDQLLLLKKICNSITIIPDSDDPGAGSMDRSAAMVISENMNCNVLILPKGAEKKDALGEPILDGKGNPTYEKLDADSFFTSQEHFEKFAHDHVQDYIIHKAYRWSTKPSTPENTRRAVDEISNLIMKMPADSRELYISQVTKLIKPRKVWTDKINQLSKDLEPVKEKTDKIERIPKHVSLVDWDKYGFYQDKNCYFFRNGKGHIEQGCNFTLEPLFHIESVENAKRIYRITNEFGITRVILLPQNSLISLGKFKEAVESLGNFLWTVGDTELNKLKSYLYAETKTCSEITQLGWQKDGFYAWSNGIYNGSFTPIDVNGIVTHDNIYYYLPAYSSIWIHELNHYVSERQFIHRTIGTITLKDYSTKLLKVFGDNAAMALCYLFASLFRDVIIQKFNFFPILDLFGPKGAGKTELAVSIMAFFGKLGKGPNINNTSKAALADHVSQLCNACVHIDEYKNNIDLDKIEFLKGLWDGTGRTRMNMDKDKKKETTKVDCGVILSGQEMPTADIALFSRLIYLTFSIYEYNDQAKADFNELKDIEKQGLTHLTNEILSHRELFKINFPNSYDQAAKDLNVRLGDAIIEDRIYKNWLVVIATFHAIQSVISVSFTYQGLLILAAKQLLIQNSETKKSNEISQFWDMVKYMAADDLIHDGIDYRIESLTSIKTDEMKSPLEFGLTKPVLFVQMSRILMLYRKHSRSSGESVLPINSINHYLRNDKRYLGKKRTRFRFLDKSQSETGTWGSRPEWAHCFDYMALGIDLNSADFNNAEDINESIPEQPTAQRPSPGRPTNMAIPFNHKQNDLEDKF